ERAAIARELHDVVAHCLAVMIVQADGATYALDSEPEQARVAIKQVAATGRDALEDMRRLVGVLRGTAPGPEPDERERPRLVRSLPPSSTRPSDAVSRPAAQCMRVDLPEPDGPMMAVNRPAAKSTLTPSRARTAVSPRPYTFTRSMIFTVMPQDATDAFAG